MEKRGLLSCLLVSLGFVILFPFVSAELGDGLIAYWNFDETEGDLWDWYNGYDGVFENVPKGYPSPYENYGVSQGLPGIIGTSYYFGGVGHYVRIKNSNEMELGDQLTFSFWLKLNETMPLDNQIPEAHTSYTILSKRSGDWAPDYYNGTGINDWEIDLVNNTLVVYFWNTTNPAHEIPFSYVNQWKHVVITYDDSFVKIYVDGVKVHEEENSGPISHGDYGVTMGFNKWWSFYKGYLDEMGIWERPLSEEEVEELYNNGEGLTYEGGDTALGQILSLLEYLQETLLQQISDINSKLEIHEDKIEACEDKIDTCQAEVDTLKQKVNELEDKVDDLESNPAPLNSPYLKYLSSGDRKAMVCGYAIDNKMTSYTDLGWNCTIKYRTYNGRTTSICTCKLLK
ncbi:MAG: LamG-like jellyroll fold domain-containing protein [Nanobdellota archaeon]